MRYVCYHTNFHTITVYSVASRYFYTHITMEVSSSFTRIEKFNKRSCTISLKEFKVTFSIMVCELKLKYGIKFTKVFTFKQLACYVHYEEDFRRHPDP